VMDAERRPTQRGGQRTGDACADEKSAGEPRTARVGNDVDGGQRQAGSIKHFAGERQDASDVIARGQLRDDAAVGSVQVDLAVQRLRDQARYMTIARFDQGNSGLIARCLDTQDLHVPSVERWWQRATGAPALLHQ
jgi:hypothetical protein